MIKKYMKFYVFLLFDLTYDMALIHKQLTDFSLVYTKSELEMFYKKELVLLINKNGFCSEYQAYSSTLDSRKNQVLLMAEFLFSKTANKENLFDKIPNELLSSMFTFESLTEVCKTSKQFYASRNTLTKTLMQSTIGLFFDEKELTQMEKHHVGPWQMITFIHSQSNFHRIGNIFPVTTTHIESENICNILYSLGVFGYRYLDMLSYRLVNKKHPDGFFSSFFPFYPNITFYIPAAIYEKVCNKATYLNFFAPCIITQFKDLSCFEENRFCHMFFEYAKYCLFNNKISILLELLQHNFPVLPKSWFFHTFCTEKEDIIYLEKFMNTPSLVDFFVDICSNPRKGPLDTTYDTENFISLVLNNKKKNYASSKKEFLRNISKPKSLHF
jgi:hypothetical protein